MTEINPDDEAITRHIVWHHRYDPSSDNFHRVAIKAFDNKRQAVRYMKKISKELEVNKVEGLAEIREFISSDIKEHNHRHHAQQARLLVRLFKKKENL